MNSRPDWDTYFLSIPRVVASRASCPRASVGAVIVSQDHRILSTGYNGAPPNEPHCSDVGCLIVDGHCQRTLHAEVNAIAHAAKVGIALDGAKLYVHMTTKAGQESKAPEIPCRECTKVMKAANVVMGKAWWVIGPAA